MIAGRASSVRARREIGINARAQVIAGPAVLQLERGLGNAVRLHRGASIAVDARASRDKDARAQRLQGRIAKRGLLAAIVHNGPNVPAVEDLERAVRLREDLVATVGESVPRA